VGTQQTCYRIEDSHGECDDFHASIVRAFVSRKVLTDGVEKFFVSSQPSAMFDQIPKHSKRFWAYAIRVYRSARGADLSRPNEMKGRFHRLSEKKAVIRSYRNDCPSPT
jgi:hypothetical protein